MHKIFKVQYEKYLSKFLIKSEGGKEIKNILSFNKKYIPVGGSLVLIKKFPVHELKNIARLECNIDRLSLEEDISNTIWATKKLRNMLKISEKSVCFTCTKKLHCKFFEESFVPPETKSKKIEEKTNANLTDLQIILNGLYKISNYRAQYADDFKREDDNLLVGEIKNDKNKESREDIFHRTEPAENNLTKEFPQYLLEDPILKRIPHKDWTSASILTEIINETMEDFLYNNGIAFRTLLNAYLESKKEEEQIQLLAKEKDLQLANEKDPVVKLLEELKKCKNRKDKRKLLAKYNKTSDFGWGEYFKINKKVDEYAKEAEYAEKAESNEEKDKEILLKEKNKNSNNNNTLLITESRLKRIKSVKNVAPLKTLNFSQKITSKTAQKKFLESQQNMSLLANQARDENMIIEDRTNIKLPGKDMGRAIKYLNSDSENTIDSEIPEADRVNIFNSYIKEKTIEKTVDIVKNVKRKLGKLDKKLEENKKFTLNPILTKRIENDIKSAEGLAIQEETKNNLISYDEVERLVALEEFESKIPIQDMRNNVTEGKNYLADRNRSLQPVNVKENSKDLSINFRFENLITNPASAIVIEKFSEENDSDSKTQLAFYKQKNLAKEDKIKKRQNESKINKIIENKHIYKSQNFYNNTNMEHIPYETDADISRTVRFEKTIKKEGKANKD